MRMNKEQLKHFAHRIGKRLLLDEGFLDGLNDALEGIDLSGALSESEEGTLSA